MFSPEEQVRYSRHFLLSEVGESGQALLKEAKVLVVGAGGLGCPLLQYLVAAGVGTIGIVDDDVVEHSNLQRQILYKTQDIGKLKVEAATQSLQCQNPNVVICPYATRLTTANALELIAEYDLVADGSDNFATRYLVNDACLFCNKPLVYASISQFQGQLSVFNVLLGDGTRTANYRDIFPMPPLAGEVLDCSEAGVLGALPGIFGTLQAVEVLKLLLKIGQPLTNRLFVMDALHFQSYTLTFAPNPENPVTGTHPTLSSLIDYEAFCGTKSKVNIEVITATELQAWKLEGKNFLLVDVREAEEYDLDNLGGILLPLSQIGEHKYHFPQNQPVVVHCKSGVRSQKAIEHWQKPYPNVKFYQLVGGIQAFRRL